MYATLWNEPYTASIQIPQLSLRSSTHAGPKKTKFKRPTYKALFNFERAEINSNKYTIKTCINLYINQLSLVLQLSELSPRQIKSDKRSDQKITGDVQALPGLQKSLGKNGFCYDFCEADFWNKFRGKAKLMTLFFINLLKASGDVPLHAWW